jgi:multidrug efflux pump subunit AcrA (membrane-fusion protein)
VLVQEPRGVKAIDRYGARMPQLPPGAPRSLLRGMFVQVRVHVDSPGELVSIPEDAQRPSGDVWVMRDGKLLVVRPQPVQSSGGRIVFESAASGLLPGDRVVTSQLSNPRAGMAIVEPGASETKSAATTEGKDAT